MAGQQQETRSLWVFGYGSLCWMPGFQFGGSAVGYIQDYVRRFWQGNTTHRGTPAQPGRVATLVEEKEGCTWGVAYELKGEAALQYLEKREVALGGYNTSVVTFFPRDPNMQPFPVLLFIATPSSRDWAGQAPLHEIATQVVRCSGPSDAQLTQAYHHHHHHEHRSLICLSATPPQFFVNLSAITTSPAVVCGCDARLTLRGPVGREKQAEEKEKWKK
ncbi:putative glutathione-specific gamma-glutamylcyclotransferase 2 isoform X3 [Scylla paramamosain]|uniref:putative glutathione-specific gamma-glutamylcyclotransferase 2 isoform X3 n=1 Tax=Scylla paramamosain TaxID=85552 RepID=UPI003082707B